MNEEQLDKIDELSLEISLELNILHNALKYTDEELEIAAVSHFVENIYKKSTELRSIF